MSDLRKLTFAINIEGNEKPVVSTDKAMDKLVKTTGLATKELGNTSDGIKDLGSNQTTSGVDKSKGKIEGLTKSLGVTQKELKDLGKSMKDVGAKATKWITVPLVGAGLAGAKLAQDLNKDMATISTMIPGQTKRLHELKGAIQDISIDVAKDTKEIANATYGVISAYGDAADTMDKVAINAKAATAGVASTDDALNLSSAIMKAFGDTSADANGKVMDLAFGTLKLGQTSFQEMASSIGRVTPLVVELGQSQEEMFAVYAAATGVTGSAAEVSTQYAGILQGLMAPTENMAKLMGSMGYSSGKAMLEGEGLIGTLQAITSETDKGNSQLKDYIGSSRGQILALQLAGGLSGDYASKLDQLSESSGMMEEAFKEQTQGINASGFSYEQSMQRMKVAGQKLGESLSPVISKVAEGFEFVSKRLAELSPETLQTVSQIGMLALSMGPLISIGGKTLGFIADIPGKMDTARTAFKVLGSGMDAFKGGSLAGVTKGIAFLTSPLGKVTLAIGLVIGAGVLLYKNWETVSQWAKSKGAEIAQDWQYTKDRTVQAWKDMTKGIGDAMGSIKDGWNNLVGIFKKPATGTVDITRNVTDKTSTTGKSTTSIASSVKVDGSHATGLARVPKNNYLANLHLDEEILTADDPRNQNNPQYKTNIATQPRDKSSGIVLSPVYSPIYNIEISGQATESDKKDIKKVIEETSRKMFNTMLGELSMQLS